MSKLKRYVIYSEDKSKISQSFIEKYPEFIPVFSFDANQVSHISDLSFFFNTEKATKCLHRKITNEEISRTLSHIKCWKTIVEDSDIQDDEFVLISESNVELAENYERLIQDYIRKYFHYGVIKLQRDDEEALAQADDEAHAIVFHEVHHYNKGTSLYLIRKNVAQQLVEKNNEIKPYWLAEQWAEFYNPENIAQSATFLGKQIKDKSLKAVDTPLFSIIVPVYNVEKYLEQCLDSVLSQEFVNYELILVDDGSTDSSMDICIRYVKKHKNIVFIHKQNGGPSESRNYGIDIARGEYIIFLDSDDYWNGTQILNDIEVLIDEHQQPDLIINYMSSVFPNHITYHIPPIKKIAGNFNSEYAYLSEKGIFVGFPYTKILKRKIIKDNKLYFMKGRLFEDVVWTFSLIRHINNYVIYPNPFYMYRRDREGSISKYVSSKNQESLFKNFYDVYTETISLLGAKPMLSSSIKSSITGMHNYAMHCYELLDDDTKLALQPLKEAHLEIYQKSLDYIDKSKNQLSNDWASLIAGKEKARLW